MKQPPVAIALTVCFATLSSQTLAQTTSQPSAGKPPSAATPPAATPPAATPPAATPPAATPPAATPPAATPPAATPPAATPPTATPPAPSTDSGQAPTQPPVDSSTPTPSAADEQPAQPEAPPQVVTGVKGTIIDSVSEVGIPAATIQVVTGGTQTASADIDGTYSLALPPGKYRIRYSVATFSAIDREVEVKEGVATTVDVTLAPVESESEEIVVRGKIDTRTESAQLATRKNAAVVSDAISAAEISRGTSSSANDAVKRVVSVSVLDGRYIALRGLEGRYVTAILNGVVLPSTEPDRNAVPLDLFPTSLLAGLTVFKSYGAELPGQFGGGTLSIDTNSFPTKFEMRFSASTSGNSVTIGQRSIRSANSKGFWGYDNGSRSLPSPVASRTVGDMTQSEMSQLGKSFRNEWQGSSETVAPNVSITATVGDTVKVAKRPLGYLVSGTMRQNFVGREGEATRTARIDGTPAPIESIKYSTGEIENTAAALGNVGATIKNGHDINLFGLYSHVGTDTAANAGGYSEPDGAAIDVERLSFVARSLSLVQLVSRHRFDGSWNPQLSLQANVTRTMRDELDTRDLIYTIDPVSGMQTYKDQPGSGQRYWSFLRETSFGTGANLQVAKGKVVAKVGASIQASDRSFRGRRFRYRWVGDDPSARNLGAQEIFDPANIGTQFNISEATLHEDSYIAGLDVFAGYASVDIQAADRLKIIAGGRFESGHQTLQNGSRFAIAGVQAKNDRVDNDLLPAVNAVYSPNETTNVRASYSYTLARPRFREMAPFLYFDYVRRRALSGNPELATTRLHNVDARWEKFLSEDEVVSTSAFFKRFEQPIEQVLADSESNATFRNAQGANLIGVELEGRVSLGRLHRKLSALRLAANVSLMRSRVELPADAMIQTSKNRPLYGQSGFVTNLAFEYRNSKFADASVLYNVIGRRISDVGIEGLADTYEEPLHRVDLVLGRQVSKHLRAKLAGSNLLNQSVRFTQGGISVDRFKPGISMMASLDWTP